MLNAEKPQNPYCIYPDCNSRTQYPNSFRCVAHKKSCVVRGCERKSNGRLRYCSMHYDRWRNSGDVGEVNPRKREDGSGTDWRLNHYGYVCRHVTVNGKSMNILQHREVMEGMLGRKLLPKENVHHKNGVKHDNRPENLELWTTSQPSGQRVEDKVNWAIELLKTYRPELFN